MLLAASGGVGAGGSEEWVRVHYPAEGSSRSGFSGMRVGGHAVLDGPYVCLTAEAPDGATVRLVDMEVEPSASGITVTALEVVPADLPSTTPVSRRGRISDVPQAASFTAGGRVSERCADDAAVEVWVELRKDAAGDVEATRSRYVYEAGGETHRTAWFDHGWVLAP